MTGIIEQGGGVPPSGSGCQPTASAASSTASSQSGIPNAVAICEQFINQVLVRRDAREEVAPTGTWHRLSLTPVASIDRVEGVVPGEFAVDIDCSGDGWVRITKPNSGPLTVHYRVGMAETMDGVPAPLTEGIDRLARHLAAGPDEEPPAVVTALWRPYRRMRLK